MDFVFVDATGALPALVPKGETAYLAEDIATVPQGVLSALLLKTPDSERVRKSAADFVVAFSAEVSFSHFAASLEKTDALVLDLSAPTLAFDAPTARVCLDHKVSVGIFFAQLVRADGWRRASMIGKAIEASSICAHARIPFRVFSGAQTASEYRTDVERSFFYRYLEEQR